MSVVYRYQNIRVLCISEYSVKVVKHSNNNNNKRSKKTVNNNKNNKTKEKEKKNATDFRHKQNSSSLLRTHTHTISARKSFRKEHNNVDLSLILITSRMR